MFLMFLIVFLYNFFSPNLQSIGKIELNYDANSLSVHWTGCTECTEQVQGSQPTQHHHLRCCCVETHSHPKSLKNLLWTILIVILEGFSLTDNNANFNVYFVRWSSVQSDEICSWCWLIITINDLYNIKIDNIRPRLGPAQPRLVTLTDWLSRDLLESHMRIIFSPPLHSDTFLPGLTKYQRHKLCGIKPPQPSPPSCLVMWSVSGPVSNVVIYLTSVRTEIRKLDYRPLSYVWNSKLILTKISILMLFTQR